MRFGFVVPYADTREFTELAALGEQHGWDGIFTWEAVFGVDAWVTLGAAAMVTERIRLGTLLTPVPRWRPWDLASRVGTVDRLSGGRAVVGAGLGALHEGWLAFEADEGRRVRAEKLDEGLAVYDGLMRGQPFSFEGRHYRARPTDFMLPPPPVQQPRPPVWVVGAWVPGRERQPSLERAARWDGLLPYVVDRSQAGPGSNYDLDSFAHVVGLVRAERQRQGLPWEGYDVVVEADSSGEFAQLEGTPSDWAQAGGTWWVESWWGVPAGVEGLAEVRRRVEQGPPA
ncbi:LLM class flavin-dependent oxidoreductase [Knoellia sp. 3-2P3]|uniref:LLM class flavin-dependent oxidoreductase n=1 Tax=unclassified Knoellia TaxID=2618719 RepID=UPI0023D97B53|nr:LLM class flavin-dependent oxidoreductase [Knoellia sp. 3-2P3]MDF2092419.1 LLM class flavin-dependent oxidoreductase [Knoellia sp. 3-2P3]